MTAAKNIANRWYSQLAGIALIAFGIAGLPIPAPTAALHRVEAKAVSGLVPLVEKTDVGKQFLALYVSHNVSSNSECHGSL